MEVAEGSEVRFALSALGMKWWAVLQCYVAENWMCAFLKLLVEGWSPTNETHLVMTFRMCFWRKQSAVPCLMFAVAHRGWLVRESEETQLGIVKWGLRYCCQTIDHLRLDRKVGSSAKSWPSSERAAAKRWARGTILRSGGPARPLPQLPELRAGVRAQP